MKAAALVAAIIVSFLAVRYATASAAGTPPPPSYRDDQARLGQTLYYENCAECHGASLEGGFGPALAGAEGNLQWDTVTYVYNYVTAHMPAGNAGGLSQKEYVEIMAFLLKVHRVPPGANALTAASANASKAMMGP